MRTGITKKMPRWLPKATEKHVSQVIDSVLAKAAR
jgi:hypothetical protein